MISRTDSSSSAAVSAPGRGEPAVEPKVGEARRGDADRGDPRIGEPPDARARTVRHGRIKALLVLLVCAAPVVASYLTYYVIKPSGRTNYGELLVQREVGQLAGVDLRGTPVTLSALDGRWRMVLASADGCRDADCAQRLYLSRQVRTTMGKDMDRVDRVLLLTGPADPPEALLQQHPGLLVMRVAPGAFADALGAAQAAPIAAIDTSPAARAASAAPTSAVDAAAADRLYLIDPLGHLMMRYPPDFDPTRLKKDLSKLLKASRVG